MGSTGTPAHEVQAVVPEFAYEIPIAWVSLDESDPPTFESGCVSKAARLAVGWREID